MAIRVVDTNVLVAANGRETHADEACQLTCIEALEKIVANGVVALDSLGLILNEYMKHCSFKGEPGVGDMFFKHTHDNQHNQAKCSLISITNLPDQPDNFLQFPNNPALNGFDPSDRKFVAISAACPRHPPICNATDSDWAEFESALTQEGITVEQLCPQHANK